MVSPNIPLKHGKGFQDGLRRIMCLNHSESVDATAKLEHHSKDYSGHKRKNVLTGEESSQSQTTNVRPWHDSVLTYKKERRWLVEGGGCFT